MAEVTTKDRKVVIILIILAIVGAWVGYTFFKYGSSGWSVIASKATSFLFWIVIIALIIGVVYFIFFYEKKIDVSYECYVNSLEECSINHNPNLEKLYTKGDKNHPSKCYGKITGWCRKQNYSVVKDKDGKKIYQDEDVFKVRVSRRKSIIIRIPSSMHDELHGDVYVDAFSLVKHGYYYYPDNKHLDLEAIDVTIHNEGVRYHNLELVSLIDPAVKKAFGLRRREVESVEGQTGLEIAKEQKKTILGK